MDVSKYVDVIQLMNNAADREGFLWMTMAAESKLYSLEMVKSAILQALQMDDQFLLEWIDAVKRPLFSIKI